MAYTHAPTREVKTQEEHYYYYTHWSAVLCLQLLHIRCSFSDLLDSCSVIISGDVFANGIVIGELLVEFYFYRFFVFHIELSKGEAILVT